LPISTKHSETVKLTRKSRTLVSCKPHIMLQFVLPCVLNRTLDTCLLKKYIPTEIGLSIGKGVTSVTIIPTTS
jgi:hypothetical protein